MIAIHELLASAILSGASDVHIRVGQEIMMRVHGRFVKLTTTITTADDAEGIVKQIAHEKHQQELQVRGAVDFAYALSDGTRFRCAVCKDFNGVAVVMRRIPVQLMSLEELRLPNAQTIIAEINSLRGLVLVTGPTGSGKTTTLATLIDHLNTGYDVHIVTIEDPIEYVHRHKRGIITQREVHIHTPGFADALRDALRQDPDVILVGEMRDLETIETALTAAETGHLVFGTLHTMNAAGTVDRIIDVFPADKQAQIRTLLSVTLKMVLAQTLVPRANATGVVAAYEIMLNNPAIANLIREAKTPRIPSTMQTSGKLGMLMMDDSLFGLVKAGLVTAQAALVRAHDPHGFQARLMSV